MTSNKQRKKKTYDIIIVGGGIAGLYSVLLLQKYNPSLKIGLFEKENRLGGRICSHRFDNGAVVAKGAGRFHSGHYRLLALLNELGIATKNTNSGHCTYYSAMNDGDGVNVQMGGDTFLQISTSPSWYPPLDALFKNYIGHPIIQQLIKNTEEVETEQTPAYSIFWKIAGYSVLEEDAVLKKTTIYNYAKKLISAKELKLFVNSFGFTDEIIKMNAYNAIRMIFGMIADVFQYMTVDGVDLGLESIIVSLVEKLNDGFDEEGCFDVFLEEEIKQIEFDETNSLFQVSQFYFAKKCIIALPKQSAITLPILKPIKKLLETIGTTSLCRIYCQFPKDKNGKVWFSGLTKGNLSNMLRCIIPIDEEKGIIMVSYSDANYAKKWNALYQDKKGKNAVENLIVELLQKSFPHLNIPKPDITEVFFWEDGVGYWLPNTDSKIISYGIVNPMKNLFVCSESYSDEYQQWIEGALETSADVVLQIMQNEFDLLPDDEYNAEYDDLNNNNNDLQQYDDANYDENDTEYDDLNNDLQKNDLQKNDVEYNANNDLQLTDIEDDEEDENNSFAK